MNKRTLGIAVVGLGGAVGSTMVAGIELLKKGLIGTTGLPLAELSVDGLADYTDIVFGGWDMNGEHLAKAAEEHDVLTHKQFVAAEESLRNIKPWPATADARFLSNIVQEQIDQPRLEFRAPAAGRFLDGATQLFLIHRADIFLVSGQCLAKLEVVRAVSVEVCP